MRIIIDHEMIKKQGLSFEQFIYLLYLMYKPSKEDIDELHKKFFYIDTDVFSDYRIVKSGIDVLELISRDERTKNMGKATIDRISVLADTLMEMFPAGKKPGTTNYWKGSHTEICDNLQWFLRKYGEGIEDETIIKATQKYINSFSIDNTLMRTLKYFIRKKIDGIFTSDLMTYIENYTEGDDVLLTTRLLWNQRN